MSRTSDPNDLSARVKNRIETLVALEVELKTLAEIEDTTWDVTLVEIDRERLLVLPDVTLDRPPGPWASDLP